jgi:hypothetical protein
MSTLSHKFENGILETKVIVRFLVQGTRAMRVSAGFAR